MPGTTPLGNVNILQADPGQAPQGDKCSIQTDHATTPLIWRPIGDLSQFVVGKTITNGSRDNVSISINNQDHFHLEDGYSIQ
jgi:hypothetical protein